jgi:tetratricopeptide (TPR) repeat protein
VSWLDLDDAARADLRSLPLSLAERVGAHLAAAGFLVDDHPEEAYRHAHEARRLAQRLAVVREAVGLTAYASARWAEAISELRAARRLGGPALHLPLIADAERALARPERALELADDAAVAGLPAQARLEMLIVAAGARRDLGDPRAAVRMLEIGALQDDRHEPALARLRYAYADALLAAGRRAAAREWFERAALIDDGGTDARERLVELGEPDPV